MENTLIFASEKEVQFGKLLKFIIPTYLTSLFNTVYTMTVFLFLPMSEQMHWLPLTSFILL